MRNISDLQVTQVRILRQDAFSFIEFLAGPDGQRIQEKFSFRAVQPSEEAPEFHLQLGKFEDITIERLSIGPRRVTLVVRGTSENASRIYSEVESILQPFANTDSIAKPTPIILTEETQCSVTFDASWKMLITPGAVDLLTTDLPSQLESDDLRARVKGCSLAIEFAFSEKDSRFSDHGVSVSNKTFRIESRMNTPLNENRFFTLSPTDSDTHLQLIAELERRWLPRDPSGLD